MLYIDELTINHNNEMINMKLVCDYSNPDEEYGRIKLYIDNSYEMDYLIFRIIPYTGIEICNMEMLYKDDEISSHAIRMLDNIADDNKVCYIFSKLNDNDFNLFDKLIQFYDKNYFGIKRDDYNNLYVEKFLDDIN